MELTAADFVIFVLLASFGTVLVFSIVSRSRHARSEARSNAEVVVCRLCLHAFEDLRDSRITSCPACGARNEKRHQRRNR